MKKRSKKDWLKKGQKAVLRQNFFLKISSAYKGRIENTFFVAISVIMATVCPEGCYPVDVRMGLRL